MSRSEQSRRRFLRNSLAVAGAGFAIGGTRTTGRVLGATTRSASPWPASTAGAGHIDEFSRRPASSSSTSSTPTSGLMEKRASPPSRTAGDARRR